MVVAVEGAVEEVRGVMKKDEVAICKGRISISTKNRGDVDPIFIFISNREMTAQKLRKMSCRQSHHSGFFTPFLHT
jgi:hypothetical protein